MNKNLSFPAFLKSAKFWAIAGFAIVLLAVPLTVWYLSQGGPQNTQQNAAQTGQTEDTCGLVHIKMNEPAGECQNGTGSGFTSRQVSIDLVPTHTLSAGENWVIDVQYVSYFCSTRSQLQGSACFGLKKPGHIQCHITRLASGAIDNGCLGIVIPKQSPPAPYTGQACGYYQEDMALNFNGSSVVNGVGSPSSCHAGTYNLSGDEPNPPGTATYCSIGDCKAPTGTPPPTMTPSPTTTPSLTPTDTPISTPSATPTGTPVLTPTNTPTGTLTPTNTPTLTPTGTLTPTASPTGTPGPTNTPAPTLPPTGPSNVVVGTGFVGVSALIIGLLLVFAL